MEYKMSCVKPSVALAPKLLAGEGFFAFAMEKAKALGRRLASCLRMVAGAYK